MSTWFEQGLRSSSAADSLQGPDGRQRVTIRNRFNEETPINSFKFRKYFNRKDTQIAEGHHLTMSTFTFGAVAGAPPLPQTEEGDDNPELVGEILADLQITDGSAAGAQLAVTGGSSAGTQNGFPLPNYHNGPLFTSARKNFYDFFLACKIVLTFGGTPIVSCGPTSNNYKLLISRLHMEYLLMIDIHSQNTKTPLAVNNVNKFLFDTSVDKLHPTQMTYFRIYKNFRDHIFKPVYIARYAPTFESMPPDDLVEGADKMKQELFRMWLTCTV